MDHTVLSANYTMAAFTPRPQSITALWLVLILPSHEAYDDDPHLAIIFIFV